MQGLDLFSELERVGIKVLRVVEPYDYVINSVIVGKVVKKL